MPYASVIRNKNRKIPCYYPNKVRNKSSKVAMGRIAMWYFYWLICLLADSRICGFADSLILLSGLGAKDGSINRAKDVSTLRDGTLRSLRRSFHQPDIQKQPRVHTLGYLKVAPTEL